MTTLKDRPKLDRRVSHNVPSSLDYEKCFKDFEKELPDKLNRLKRLILNWRVVTWKSDMDTALSEVIAKWNKEEISG